MDTNLLELLGVVVSAYVLVEMTEDRPGRKGEAVMMRADNTRAVGWVRTCRGGKKDKARVGALMRWLGVFRMISAVGVKWRQQAASAALCSPPQTPL